MINSSDPDNALEILKIAAIEYMKLGDNKVSTFTVCSEDS